MLPSPGELLHFSEDPSIRDFAPHVAATAVEEGDVLVLGCDGIFDELSDEMVAGVLARVGDNPRLAAQMLRDEAFFLGSADNLSCIVASLK